MIVIHIKSTIDTEDFEKLYKDLDATVLINPSKSQMKRAIKKEKDCVMIIGHGSEYGLFNHNLDGYILDSSIVNLLRNKIIIGVWCYAGNFADKYNLKGFFTSNFISNSSELVDNGFQYFEGCDDVIQRENILFSEKINKLIIDKTPLREWINDLQNNCSNYDFVKYNYEALYYD